MKFILLEKQVGTGCDYTIACGQRWSFISAESEEKAIEKVLGKKPVEEVIECEDDDDDDDDDSVFGYDYEKLLLVTDTGKVIDLMPIGEEYIAIEKAMKAKAVAAKKEAAEKAEFERLSKKFAKNKT